MLCMHIIRKEADCAAANFVLVAVQGVYRAMMLPRSARPGSPLFESDRAVIELEDGHHIALETHGAGIRPPDERDRFLGKTVRAKGFFMRWAQLWGSPEESSIIMDALTGVELIEELG